MCFMLASELASCQVLALSVISKLAKIARQLRLSSQSNSQIVT